MQPSAVTLLAAGIWDPANYISSCCKALHLDNFEQASSLSLSLSLYRGAGHVASLYGMQKHKVLNCRLRLKHCTIRLCRTESDLSSQRHCELLTMVMV